MNKNLLHLEKFEPEKESLITEVLTGFEKEQKQLPCKLFYDKRGSALFDEICGLEEYYPTRTEIGIMKDSIADICSFLGKNCLLVELGSGSSIKIRMLLDNLINPSGYVPIDISEEHLMDSVKSLAQDYPGLRIIPVHADYTQPLNLPRFDFPFTRTVFFYPGSTIGNFTPESAGEFLKRIAKRAGRGSGLLIGVDLVKDVKTLEDAYNDAMGVTAEFNLNILKRLNREIGSDFDMAKWKHKAFFNTDENRIEMHLESVINQRVNIDGASFRFKKDETILTEYSYKYTIEGFNELVSESYSVEKVWTDGDNKFSVQYLKVR